jgi:hypothetical protein
MNLSLKYGEVYDLFRGKKEYKGVYLGQKNIRGKHSLSNLILVNYLFRQEKENFCIFGFKDFKFENNKLHLGPSYRIPISENQKAFYENLLETKLKKDFIKVFAKSRTTKLL